MNGTSTQWLQELLLFLTKGMGWLLLCGLARLALPRAAPTWRLTLTTMLLLSTASLLPSLWIWKLPSSSNPDTSISSVSSSPEGLNNPVPAPLGVNPAALPPPVIPLASTRPWQDWVVLVWLGGTVGLIAWLAAGFLMARRWIREAQPLTGAGWEEILTAECRQQTLTRRPRIFASRHVPGPCVAGTWRPVILLPQSCQDWNPETRRLVLRHELAHVRHGDSWQAWVRALILILHWPNPLVWPVIALSRRNQEMAADAAVLAAGTAPDQYASTLLFVARSCQFHSRSPLLTAMALTTALEFRIRHLLSMRPAPQSPVRYAAAGIGLTALAAVFLGCSTVQRGAKPTDDIFLAGAETPIQPIDSQELEKLLNTTPSKAGKFIMSFRIIDQAGRDLQRPFNQTIGDRTISLFPKTATLRSGQKGIVQTIREFPQPTSYDPPQWPSSDPTRPPVRTTGPGLDNGGHFPVIPSTPQKFVVTNIGWEIKELSVQPEGAFLTLSGTFHERTFDGLTRNAGEAYSTIVTQGTNAFGRKEQVDLTDNKVLSPTFTSRETPFRVTALPGKSYRLRLNLKQPDAFLEVSCAPMEK